MDKRAGVLVLVAASCSQSHDPEAAGDGDIDADVDSDGDADGSGGDADSDSDGDGDDCTPEADADVDGDADPAEKHVPPEPGDCWSVEESEPAGAGAEVILPVITIDSGGTSWIAYSAYQWQCAEQPIVAQVLDDAGGAWRLSTILRGAANEARVGMWVALGPDDALHLVHPDFTVFGAGPTLHSTGGPGAWVSTAVDAEGGETPVAVGPDGTVWVAYDQWAGNDGTLLQVAALAPSGAWRNEVAIEGRMLHGHSIGVGPDGTVHVSVLDACPEVDGLPCDAREEPVLPELLHAWRTGAGWAIETVATGLTQFGAGSRSLAIDADGDVHIAFMADGWLRHAVSGPEGWVVTDVARADDDSPRLALAIGPDGSVQIAAATRAADLERSGMVWFGGRDGAWTSEVVDRTFSNLPSLAVGPDGTPAVAYTGSGFANRTLRFARRCAPF